MLENYGIDARLEPLASERDQNFLATGSDGSMQVLKFANAYESKAITDFQVQGLLHVARVDPDFPVPRIVPTNDGELIFEVDEKACDKVADRAREVMEGAADPTVKLDVPLLVDAGRGENWAEAH